MAGTGPESQRPSTALLAVLAASVLLAGWVYGRPLLLGSDEFDDEEFLETDDLGFVDDEPPAPIEEWVPPAEPRDPFLPIDLGGDADVDDEFDGDFDGDFDDDPVDEAVEPPADDDEPPPDEPDDREPSGGSSEG